MCDKKNEEISDVKSKMKDLSNKLDCEEEEKYKLVKKLENLEKELDVLRSNFDT